jgi:DNA-binding IscR family transcriptional regulator
VDAVEGSVYPMHCVDDGDHTCFQDGRCGLQELWSDVHVAVRSVFERISVADLIKRHARVSTPLFRPEDLVRPT